MAIATPPWSWSPTGMVCELPNFAIYAGSRSTWVGMPASTSDASKAARRALIQFRVMSRALRELRRQYPDSDYVFCSERGGPVH